MSHVITLTGPSRAGKSTTIRYLLERENAHFRPELVPKYTTRSPRKDDKREVICVEQIPGECDLVYQLYDRLYGLEMRTLFDLVAQGKSPLVILNDVRVVEDVRNAFRELVESVFIFRQNPLSKEYRKELLDSRGEEDGLQRFLKAQTIFRTYIENIHLFDHVIINYGTLGNLKWQVQQIVEGLGRDPDWPLW